MTDDASVLFVDYTNWRGERRERLIRPVEVWFGSNEYHEGEQWFLRSVDLETGETKDFALLMFHRISKPARIERVEK